MSENNQFDLDLDLQILPAWATQNPEENKYANFKGGGEGSPRDARSSGRQNRQGGFGGFQDRGNRPPPRGGGGGGGDRRGGPRRDDRGRDSRDDRSAPQFAPRPLEPLPDYEIDFVPESAFVQSIARQLKQSGRAYPLFNIAALFIKKPESYRVIVSTKKGADGKAIETLWKCNVDQTIWTSEKSAMDHLLKVHFATFYQAEKTATEAPKGTYTFVAQCGVSGVILGPPNYHNYQTRLHKLHTEKFSRMPFEVFKSRVKIVKDEAIVKQWIEEQSFKTEFVCLNLPEPKRLASMAEVEAHFREVHLPNVISQVDKVTVAGNQVNLLRGGGLSALFRRTLDQQRRFPLKLVTPLSQQFSGEGLHFFKVDKHVTHVSIARPRFLDVTTAPLSEGVRKVVEFVSAHPDCTRRKLFDALAPSAPAPKAAPAVTETAPAPATAATDAAPAAPVEAAAPVAAAEPQYTPEQRVVAQDLHWLVHQGHIIEFSTGKLRSARKPAPKPQPAPKPAKAKVEAGAPAVPATEAAATAPEIEVADESAPEVAAAPAEAAPAAPAPVEPPAQA